MGLTFSFFVIYSIFLLINLGILWNDIFYRKIPNIFLGFLLILLPVWWYIIPGSTTQLPILLSLSGILLLGGVLISKSNGFFGSGDIKYISILILFLGSYSFPIFVGNIGFLTVCVLLFWWVILITYCYRLRGSIGIEEKKILLPIVKASTVCKNALILIFDWIIIGFFLSVVIKELSVQIFDITTSNGDFYFILSLLIFLIRPGLKYILIEWRYRIFPVFAILLFFGMYIQKNGGEALIQELYIFIANIWKYILLLTSINIISIKTFSLYDSLIEKSKTKNMLHTIPYSLIIFGGYISLYFFDINFIDFIRKL